MYTRDDVERELATLLSERFGVPRDSIGPDSNLFADLGLDSVDLMSAVSVVEEKYDLTLRDEDLEESFVFGKLVEKIHGKLAAS